MQRIYFNRRQFPRILSFSAFTLTIRSISVVLEWRHGGARAVISRREAADLLRRLRAENRPA